MLCFVVSMSYISHFALLSFQSFLFQPSSFQGETRRRLWFSSLHSPSSLLPLPTARSPNAPISGRPGLWARAATLQDRQGSLQQAARGRPGRRVQWDDAASARRLLRLLTRGKQRTTRHCPLVHTRESRESRGSHGDARWDRTTAPRRLTADRTTTPRPRSLRLHALPCFSLAGSRPASRPALHGRCAGGGAVVVVEEGVPYLSRYAR